MRRYHVRYIIDPAVPLTGEIFFGTSDRDAEDALVRVTQLPSGRPDDRTGSIAVDIQMEAESLDKALQAGFRIANVVGSVMSYLARTGLTPPFLKTGFDFTDDRRDHEFIQVIDLNLYRRQDRGLTKEDFEALVKKLNGMELDARERVPRALRWYAHANQESNHLLRLLAYWFALESLEPLLAQSIPNENRSSEQRTSKGDAPKTPGIRSVFEKVAPDGTAAYDRIRRLRNEVVHASGILGRLEDDAKLLHPTLAVVAFAAIAQVLNYTPPGKADDATQPAVIQQRLSIRTTINSPGPGPFHAGNQLPHFDESEFLRAGTGILKLDELFDSGQVKLTPVMASGVVVGDTALTIHDRSVEFANVTIEVHRPESEAH